MPTVREELAFGPENLGLPAEEIERRIERVALKLGIKALLDKPVFELSYGQKRLVSIACVLTMEPPLLILDEPTNGLDRENWERVLSFLEKTPNAVLVITHDRELIRRLRWRVVYLSELSFVSSLNLNMLG
jgi:cobalt/nickel transport system ATP-binding protein